MTVETFSLTGSSETSTSPPPSPSDLAVLGPYQGRWNELVFGEGTKFPLVENLNLLEYEARISDQPLPQGDGDIVYGRWASGRFVVLSFVIPGVPLSLDHEDAVSEWQAAWRTDDPYRQDWLVFRTSHRTYLVRARVARRRIELSPVSTRSGRTTAVVELKVSDPRVYLVDEETGSATKSILISTTPPSGGGFDLATELPLDMVASSGSSTVAVNDGSGIAYPVIRVSNLGPGNTTSVTITNVTTGVIVEVDTVITPGQTLVLDFDGLVRATTGPHIHIDGSSRYGDWQHPRIPLGFDPGPNVLTGAFTGGASVIRADWMENVL